MCSYYIFRKYIPGSSEYLLARQAFDSSHVAKAELKFFKKNLPFSCTLV